MKKPTPFANFDKHTQQYLNLVQEIIAKNDADGAVTDRTKVGRSRIFGRQLTFDMTDGSFPLITCKHVPFRLVKAELDWFLSGSTNIYDNPEYLMFWEKWALKHDITVERDCNLSEHISNMFSIETTLSKFLEKTVAIFTGNWKKEVTYYKGDIGPMYGKTWRNFDGVDQIADVYKLLQNQPYTARACISAWDPKNFPITDPDFPNLENDYEYQVVNGRMALNPCHAFFQFLAEPMTWQERLKWLCSSSDELVIGLCNETKKLFPSAFETDTEKLSIQKLHVLTDFLDTHNVPSNYLSLKLTQRSCDVGLGAPFNIASYALLLNMFSLSLNMATKELIYSLGDAHLYSNQIAQMRSMVYDAKQSTDEYKAPRLSTVFDHMSDETLLNSQVIDYSVPVPWEQESVSKSMTDEPSWKVTGYRNLGTYKMDAAA